MKNTFLWASLEKFLHTFLKEFLINFETNYEEILEKCVDGSLNFPKRLSEENSEEKKSFKNLCRKNVLAFLAHFPTERIPAVISKGIPNSLILKKIFKQIFKRNLKKNCRKRSEFLVSEEDISETILQRFLN